MLCYSIRVTKVARDLQSVTNARYYFGATNLMDEQDAG
jgi:hypothetical protein